MKCRKSCQYITCATRQKKKEFLLCCSTLAAELDTELFEDYGINNYMSFFSKEISIDFACVPIQHSRRLSKLIGLNVFGMNEKKHN